MSDFTQEQKSNLIKKIYTAGQEIIRGCTASTTDITKALAAEGLDVTPAIDAILTRIESVKNSASNQVAKAHSLEAQPIEGLNKDALIAHEKSLIQLQNIIKDLKDELARTTAKVAPAVRDAIEDRLKEIAISKKEHLIAATVRTARNRMEALYPGTLFKKALIKKHETLLQLNRKYEKVWETYTRQEALLKEYSSDLPDSPKLPKPRAFAIWSAATISTITRTGALESEAEFIERVKERKIEDVKVKLAQFDVVLEQQTTLLQNLSQFEQYRANINVLVQKRAKQFDSLNLLPQFSKILDRISEDNQRLASACYVNPTKEKFKQVHIKQQEYIHQLKSLQSVIDLAELHTTINAGIADCRERLAPIIGSDSILEKLADFEEQAKSQYKLLFDNPKELEILDAYRSIEAKVLIALEDISIIESNNDEIQDLNRTALAKYHHFEKYIEKYPSIIGLHETLTMPIHLEKVSLKTKGITYKDNFKQARKHVNGIKETEAAIKQAIVNDLKSQFESVEKERIDHLAAIKNTLVALGLSHAETPSIAELDKLKNLMPSIITDELITYLTKKIEPSLEVAYANEDFLHAEHNEKKVLLTNHKNKVWEALSHLTQMSSEAINIKEALVHIGDGVLNKEVLKERLETLFHINPAKIEAIHAELNDVNFNDKDIFGSNTKATFDAIADVMMAQGAASNELKYKYETYQLLTEGKEELPASLNEKVEVVSKVLAHKLPESLESELKKVLPKLLLAEDEESKAALQKILDATDKVHRSIAKINESHLPHASKTALTEMVVSYLLSKEADDLKIKISDEITVLDRVNTTVEALSAMWIQHGMGTTQDTIKNVVALLCDPEPKLNNQQQAIYTILENRDSINSRDEQLNLGAIPSLTVKALKSVVGESSTIKTFLERGHDLNGVATLTTDAILRMEAIRNSHGISLDDDFKVDYFNPEWLILQGCFGLSTISTPLAKRLEILERYENHKTNAGMALIHTLLMNTATMSTGMIFSSQDPQSLSDTNNTFSNDDFIKKHLSKVLPLIEAAQVDDKAKEKLIKLTQFLQTIYKTLDNAFEEKSVQFPYEKIKVIKENLAISFLDDIESKVLDFDDKKYLESKASDIKDIFDDQLDNAASDRLLRYALNALIAIPVLGWIAGAIKKAVTGEFWCHEDKHVNEIKVSSTKSFFSSVKKVPEPVADEAHDVGPVEGPVNPPVA